MRTNRSRIRNAAVVLALSGIAAGSIALSMSMVQTRVSTEPVIGDAQVAVGRVSARVVEQVAYREGVKRVADVVIVDGEPQTILDNPDVAAAWDLVDSVWPASLRGELGQLSVIDEGPRGLVGVVHRSSIGGWILSIDRADLSDRRLVQETIIHEIAHVVTLAPDVFSFDTAAACDGVSITVGCAFPGTLMAGYAQRFWPGGVSDASVDSLVDAYAATGPHEDLAETFTAWVAGWPDLSTAARSRVDMLAADPRMSGLAAEIRAQMG